MKVYVVTVMFYYGQGYGARVVWGVYDDKNTAERAAALERGEAHVIEVDVEEFVVKEAYL